MYRRDGQVNWMRCMPVSSGYAYGFAGSWMRSIALAVFAARLGSSMFTVATGP